ncbi:MAG: AAA family ATPase, partial [Gammaproteobacteria bacterium]|nr:AAA family ATPase [Gammaproteobacteria bacterium]
MFGQFFNIDESAFSIAPNPKYLYLSKQHEEALAHLVYGITCKGGFVLLTGDIGTGKTTI